MRGSAVNTHFGVSPEINSAEAESYGVLKEIEAVHNEKPDVWASIVGHTDSDGGAGRNLRLSKDRSAAVKASLKAVAYTALGNDMSRPIWIIFDLSPDLGYKNP